MGVEYFGGPRVLNGLSEATQTFSVGTTGTNFAISSSGGTHTFNIPDAGASARGLVTTGTQTLAGAKTFTGAITASGTVTINNPTNSAAVVRINAAAAGAYPTQYSTWNGNSAFICYLEDSADNPAFGVLSVGGDYAKVTIGLNSGEPFIGFGPGNAGRDVFITRDSAATLALRNAANAQTFRVYSISTSSTSYERLNIRGKSTANFEIGPENGNAGGTRRGLTIGGYYDGSATITPWISFTSSGDTTFSNAAAFSHANGVTINGSCWVSTFGSNAGFRNLRANGTSGSPTQVLSGDVVGFYSARGYHNGGAYHTNHGGYWGFTAVENFTATAQGTTFALQTTSAGAAAPTERMFIDSAGVTIFAGEVRVPTASPGTNTTQAASTAFVTAAVTAGGGGGSGITAARVLSYSLMGG
jgi:hypothetical protein